MEAAAAASMEAAAAAASSVAAPVTTLATQTAATTLVQTAVADAAAASSVAASAASAASSSASAVSAAAASVSRVAELSCPNWSPFARAIRCPVGSESLWLPTLGVPAWVLLSHSAQGTLGLFSLKHLLLHQMPTIKSWMEKLHALTNEGRLHVVGSTASRNASGARSTANAARDDAERPVGLPALLSAPASRNAQTAAAAASANTADASSASASASSLSAAPAPPSPHAAHLALMQQLYEASATDQLAALGTNVHESVLSFFSARELAELMLVSKSWYRAANADHLWSALNEREIMKQFLSPESGLYEVIQGMESDSNAAELLASSSSSSSSRNDAPVLPKRRAIPFDSIIRSQQHSICHIVTHIATSWQAHMFSGLPAHQPSPEFEADLLSEVHQLTQAIAKLNTFLGYIKAAEKHARQVLQRKSGAGSSMASTAAPALMSRYESTSALLLTACALVQACHRFCSGVTPAKPRPRISRQASSTSSSSSSATPSSSAASSSPTLAASPAPAAASMQSIHDEIAAEQQQAASSSMARDSDLLSQVIEGQEGIRRRRTAAAAAAAEQSDDALPAPASSPALASAASYTGPASSSFSSSSSSSSSTAPSLQRSMSTPTPVTPPAARNSLLHLLPERRWQTIGDILLLMEQSGLLHFQFSVADVIRLNEAPAVAAAAAAAQAAAAQGNNAGASSSAVASTAAAAAPPAAAAAAAPAPNDPDDPNDSDSEFGDNDDDEDGEDDSGEDSDDSEDELPPAPAAPVPAAAAPGAPAAAPAAPALPPAHQPAARARHARRWILAADIDELDNIFLTAIPIDEASPKTNTTAEPAGTATAVATASSSTVPAIASESTEAAAALPSASSSESAASASSPSSSADSTAEVKQDTPAAAASSSSASSSSATPSDHELRQRALALAVDELANGSSHSPAKTRRPPASAKAAYKESLHFLRVQQGLDESKRDERKLVRSQQQTARLHDLLRHAFKLLIFCSMLWSVRDSGVIHLLVRFGAWICLLWSALSWYGIELELELDDGAHMQMPAHNHNHGHAHLPGPGFAQIQNGQHQDEPPLPPAPLLPAPLMQPLQLALDWFGLMALGPAAQEQMGAIMPNQIAPQPLLADHAAPAAPAVDVAALQQRKRLRRVLLCLSCVLAVESLNYFLGHGNPEWFTQLLLTLVRFTPLSFGITTVTMMAVSGLTWRNRWLQGILLASVMLECAFWTFEFRSRSMELFGLFLWRSVAPRMWKLAVAAARLAPLSSVLVALGYMVTSMAMIIVPVVMDAILEPAAAPAPGAGAALAAHGMPVVNLNPAAQNWTLLYNIVRHNPDLRRCYKLFGITCMAAAVAEGAYHLAGFDLPWIGDAWSKLRSIAPILASVMYDLTVTEGRGLMLGLALLRFIWVVDQSLPIASLSILTGGRRAKKPAPSASALRRKESSTAAATPQSSPPLSRQVSEAGSADSSSSSSGSGAAPARSSSLSPAAPLVVCLSCARHACPFTIVRWLQDFLFESSLLCSWPLSGVQAMHVQKHEQNMQMTDTSQTILAARQAQRRERESQEGAAALPPAEAEDEDDLPLQIKTCNSCLLHSIRAQLVLPFVYLLILYLIFSVLLPPPPYSSYRELLLAGAHYLLDRVPCVALFDLVQGAWTGRVLQWKRAYLGLTFAVLSYACYVVWVSWAYQIGAWFLLPGFLYQPMFNGASWLLLDAAWLAVWTIN